MGKEWERKRQVNDNLLIEQIWGSEQEGMSEEKARKQTERANMRRVERNG